MTTLTFSLTTNDPQKESDAQAVLDEYEGADYNEKAKDYFKKKMKEDINKKRQNDHHDTYSGDIDDIESQ